MDELPYSNRFYLIGNALLIIHRRFAPDCLCKNTEVPSARWYSPGAWINAPRKCTLPFSLSALNLAHRVAAWSQLSFHDMIELIQFPWSPFCIVQRRILEICGEKFKITNIPNGDRSLVWRVTRQRYYGVPIIREGGSVVFEVDDNSQVIDKYLDSKFRL